MVVLCREYYVIFLEKEMVLVRCYVWGIIIFGFDFIMRGVCGLIVWIEEDVFYL